MNDVAAKNDKEDRENDPLLQWVTFRLGDETYGMDVMQIQEVLRVSDIAPVPGAQDYVIGIINLRGNVVTVIDARKRFRKPVTEPDDNSRIIITEVDEQSVGLLVDSVAEVVYLRASEIDSAPEVGNDPASRYIQGVVTREDGLLILVDLKKLLGEGD